MKNPIEDVRANHWDEENEIGPDPERYLNAKSKVLLRYLT